MVLYLLERVLVRGQSAIEEKKVTSISTRGKKSLDRIFHRLFLSIFTRPNVMDDVRRSRLDLSLSEKMGFYFLSTRRPVVVGPFGRLKLAKDDEVRQSRSNQLQFTGK